MRERKTKGDLTLILQMMAGCSSTAGALLTGSLPQQDDGSAFLLQFLTWMERYLEDKGTTFAQACADKMLRLGVVFEGSQVAKEKRAVHGGDRLGSPAE